MEGDGAEQDDERRRAGEQARGDPDPHDAASLEAADGRMVVMGMRMVVVNPCGPVWPRAKPIR